MKQDQKTFEIDRMSQDSWRMFRTMGEIAVGFDRITRRRGANPADIKRYYKSVSRAGFKIPARRDRRRAAGGH